MNAKEVLEYAKKNGVELVDLRFTDWPGQWQHCTYPISEIDEDTFEDGLGFDGSSIRGWQAINESDMLMVPAAETGFIDPFMKHSTLVLICNIEDPITREPYTRDPRWIARKAENHLKGLAFGDTAYFGPEAEFFLFQRAEDGSPTTVTHDRGAYFDLTPVDKGEDCRRSIVNALEKMGFEIEAAHHEVAPGQHEIDFKYDEAVTTADKIATFKLVVRKVALDFNLHATFMPKPIFNDNGSGMHLHQSIWRDGNPLFAGDGYGGLSKMAMYYIGGIMKHAKTLCAFTNPSTNSYKRLVPGYEAPVNLAYSNRNRSASLRIPVTDNPKSKRVEYRTPDPSCNGYLAFAAQLMAGLDGIENKIDPGEPLDKDIYGLSPEELNDIPSVAGTLDEALNCLEADHDFLLKGDVFTKDVIDMWISYKREAEVDAVRMRPCPEEFALYYDC